MNFAGAAEPDFISGKKGQADLLAGDKPLHRAGNGRRGRERTSTAPRSPATPATSSPRAGTPGPTTTTRAGRRRWMPTTCDAAGEAPGHAAEPSAAPR